MNILRRLETIFLNHVTLGIFELLLALWFYYGWKKYHADILLFALGLHSFKVETWVRFPSGAN